MQRIQYTIRRVSPALDAELRREASETGKTLNAMVPQTLEDAKLPSATCEHNDLGSRSSSSLSPRAALTLGPA
jgi:hypothetical protein